MSEKKIATTATQLGLSLDVWAVLTSFFLALLVRIGLLKHIPW
jgi:hypothetical protein